MDPKVEGLARRFKEVLDSVEHGRQAARERRERVLAEARVAREELLDSLVAFGEATGHLQVVRDDQGLTFSWRDRSIRFVAREEGDRLHVELHDPSHESLDTDGHIIVFRHPDAGDMWVLAVGRPGAEVAEPLFDAGLVHLLVEGLGLPAPIPAPPAPQPPLDALVPNT